MLARYADVRFNDEGLALAGDELVRFLEGRERAITALERIDGSVLSRLPELKVISKVGVGIDMLDLDALSRHGVRLARAGGTNAVAVAELVIGLLLALLRGLPRLDSEVRAGGWHQPKGSQLSGRTVGIVGYGSVGIALARLLSGFGCPVLAHDVRSIPATDAVRQVELEDLLAESDVVSLHLALDEATRCLLDERRISQMKPGAILVNTARGQLVDETALVGALRAGHLSGACLDVFKSEPPLESPLLELDQVVVSPHIGGSTEEAILAMGRAAISGLERAVNVSELA
jgi:D-3-phosphoglycerate dehydrogenase